MVLHIFSTVVSQAVPSTYYLPAALIILVIATIRAYAQGRRTNRDRDLHARTVILTGPFMPLGLTLLEFLAKRGAHIIALVPTPSLTSHHAEILSLLRETTGNKDIYAEPCPLDSPAQIKKFCERFVNTENEENRRVDALIMAHEYGHIGTWAAGFADIAALRREESLTRDEAAMATFLLTTLLLPALLVAPTERDIRIINIVNPFYAAAAPAFSPTLSSSTYRTAKVTTPCPQSKSDITTPHRGHVSKWSLEGQRALRSAVFIHHLQRILDALPGPGSSSLSSTSASSTPHSNPLSKLKPQPSNVLAVTVSPGISRTDTVAPYLFPPISGSSPSLTRQWVAALLYIFLQPVLRSCAKTPTSALQTVLHALCVPKPLRRRHTPLGEDPAQPPPRLKPPAEPNVANTVEQQAEEVLVPGALYADCAVVKLNLRVAPEFSLDEVESEKMEDKVDRVEQFDLGLGDEPLGRAVWEALEEGVKIWETQEKTRATPKGTSKIEDDVIVDI